MWSRSAEEVEDTQAEMAEVEHAEGAAEDGAEAVVEAFGGAVAGTRDKIIRDLVLPSLQRVAELVEGGQTQRAGGGQPLCQAGEASRSGRE